MVAQVGFVLPLASAGLVVKDSDGFKTVTNNRINNFIGVKLVLNGRTQTVMRDAGGDINTQFVFSGTGDADRRNGQIRKRNGF